MRVNSVSVGPVELSVAEAGNTDGAPLLLLHGFTGAKEDFTDWLDPLADRGWHAVAPDQRGHGASAKPAAEDAYSYAIFAQDALALADQLGWEQFTLLGHSMGGMVAQVLALAAPGRLQSLVLMDTHHGAVEGVDRNMAEGAISLARTQGMDALADVMAKLSGVTSTPADLKLRAERPGYVEFNDRKLRSASAAMYAAMAYELLDAEDRLDALRGLPTRTLVIVGEQDVGFLGASERMAAAMPGAELTVVPGGGHSPQFEAPEPWWDALTGFLDG